MKSVKTQQMQKKIELLTVFQGLRLFTYQIWIKSDKAKMVFYVIDFTFYTKNLNQRLENFQCPFIERFAKFESNQLKLWCISTMYVFFWLKVETCTKFQ